MKCAQCQEDKSIYEFYRRTNGRLRRTCKACHIQAVVIRQQRIKQLSVEYKGGCCEQCGYKKCLAALEFHHQDPTEKDPDWKIMKNHSFAKLKPELDKCILLCANCHREVHALLHI